MKNQFVKSLKVVVLVGVLASTVLCCGCELEKTKKVTMNIAGQEVTGYVKDEDNSDSTTAEQASDSEYKSTADAALEKVEYNGGSGMEAEHTFYMTVSKEKWDAGWRIGDLWGVKGKGPVTTDNATTIMTAEESMYEVSDFPSGRKLVKWKTSLASMGDEFADGDEVTIGVNLVNMSGDSYEEGPISPDQFTLKWATK